IEEKAGKISEKLTSVETKVNNINDDVTNLLVDSGTFEGAQRVSAVFPPRWYLKGGDARLSTDTFQGNSVYEVQANWSGIAYNFKDLIDRGVVKAGDKVTYSIYSRVKGLADGQTRDQTFFFYTGATGITLPTVTNQWKRVNATFTVTTAMMALTGTTIESFMRVEPSVGGSGSIWYQQSTPQLTVGDKVYTWRPAPEDLITNGEFNKKTTEIEKSVGGIKESIKTVEKTQVDFNERVNTVEKNAEGTTASVKKLQETQTEQGKTLTQATTTIQQHSEALKLTMKKKDVEDYVGGLGTVNVLRDTGFRFDRKYWYWNTDAGAMIKVDKNLQFKGLNTLSVTVSGQTQNRWWGLTGQYIPANAGEDWVASGYFNHDGKPPAFDNGTGAFVEIEWFDAAKKRISTNRAKANIINHTWVRVEITGKAPTNTKFVRYRVYAERNGRFWLGAPMLQMGKKASEFWENPKDQTDVDKMMDDIADRIATEQFNKRISEIQREIRVSAEGIEAAAKKRDIYVDTNFAKNSYVRELEGRLKVTEDNVSISVKEDNIIAKINVTKENILLNAQRIDLRGYVTAQHIRGQVLEGVTLKTAPSSEKRWVEMNKQDIRLYDAGEARTFLGFYNQKNGDLQPTFILGSNASSEIPGSFVVTTVIPKTANGYDYNRSVATIGMAGWYNATENIFRRNSEIVFYKENGGMFLNAYGPMNLKTRMDMFFETAWDNGGRNIQFEATRMFYVMAHGQINMKTNTSYFLESVEGKWMFQKTNSGGNTTLISDNGNDVDIRFAYTMLRSSHVPGYQGKIQVKNVNGNEFRDLEVRNIEHNGRIIQRSTQKLKEGVRDVDFSPLEKIMELKLKSYYLKTEMARLYEMRMHRKEGDELPTLKDLDVSYGFIAEQTDKVFLSPPGDGIDMYSTTAIHIAATQEIYEELQETQKENEKLKEHTKELIDRLSRLEGLVEELLLPKES
ncbi:tail fiber domain-containing protein, partial [Bacillus paranthracis]|nr:tail fiber domain-containing protein [Bacillus paranthracis]